jgi:mono/diheme cytochrome c family protein
MRRLTPREMPWHTIFWVVLGALTLALQACMMPGGPSMGRGRIEPRPAVTPAPTATPGDGTAVSFRQDVLPVLRQRCASCHGGQAGLYLDNYDSLMATTLNRGIIVPGNPEESILVKLLRGEVQPRMPLGGQPLSDEQIGAIVQWIREGVPNN